MVLLESNVNRDVLEIRVSDELYYFRNFFSSTSPSNLIIFPSQSQSVLQLNFPLVAVNYSNGVTAKIQVVVASRTVVSAL